MKWFDLAGLIGVAIILAAYALHVMRRMSSRAIAYSALNASGAALILVSLYFAFNLSAAVMEGVWFAVSVYGLFRAFQPRRRRGKPL
jgi:hypothetical protein